MKVSLKDILTPSEIERAREIYAESLKPGWTGTFNGRVVGEIIDPAIDRINKTLGQENDPRYIGYAIEYCLMREEKPALTGPSHNRKWKVR